MELNEDLRDQIEGIVTSADVVVFMKGHRRMPQCGFSARVVHALDEFLDDYETVDVLEDPEIRDGVKAYSEWPTIPQLYVKGQFVGGCDIVLEMHESGELSELLGSREPTPEVPKMTLSDTAKEALLGALQESGESHVLFSVTSNFHVGLDLGAPKERMLVFDLSGVPMAVGYRTAARAEGVHFDFVPGERGGFRISNPNEPPKVKLMTPAELKERLDAGERLTVLDVRPEQERALAQIEAARPLTQGTHTQLLQADKESTTLVFHCHHGGRSQAAAEQYIKEGFTTVYNLVGGIDAWSCEVDTSVPRY